MHLLHHFGSYCITIAAVDLCQALIALCTKVLNVDVIEEALRTAPSIGRRKPTWCSVMELVIVYTVFEEYTCGDDGGSDRGSKIIYRF